MLFFLCEIVLLSDRLIFNLALFVVSEQLQIWVSVSPAWQGVESVMIGTGQ